MLRHKHFLFSVAEVIDQPVFGIPLTLAIERNRSHDGVQLPALFRECIDYIEEHGKAQEIDFLFLCLIFWPYLTMQ